MQKTERIPENRVERRTVVGIGVFDGVHLGHARVLAAVRELAARTQAIPAAVTFDPHPRQVVAPENAPCLLIPLAERLRLLREYGMADVTVIPFTKDFAAMPPEKFLAELAERIGGLCGICVGANWRFGVRASGGAAELAAFAQARRIGFTPVPELEQDGRIVSSTEIRRAMAAGDLAGAEKMLGRPYRIFGTVERGFRAATGDLGCPTANLRMRDGVLPPDGVYAARAFPADGGVYPAAVNIGFAPTYRREKPERRTEVHLLDYAGDLYGQALGVELLCYLRTEQAFPDPDALRRQIALDIRKIREMI